MNQTIDVPLPDSPLPDSPLPVHLSECNSNGLNMDCLQLEIQQLKEEIKKLQIICSRMDKHIDFVENAYDNFKYPLNVVKQKIEGIFGNKKIN